MRRIGIAAAAAAVLLAGPATSEGQGTQPEWELREPDGHALAAVRPDPAHPRLP